MTFRYYLNIGTNLGDREQNLESAIKALSDGAERVKESEVVKSKPWGFESPNEFLNVGVALDSTIEPFDMLDHTRFGTLFGQRFAPRRTRQLHRPPR